METEDEEVRAVGRTYRTPIKFFVPSTALVEGRAPVLAPYGPGGAGGGGTSHPLPCARVSTSEQSDIGASILAIWKLHLQSVRTLLPPRPLPPPSALEAPEVLWQ